MMTLRTPHASPFKFYALSGIFLGLAICFFYGQTLAFNFLYDDFETIVDNPYVSQATQISPFFLNASSTSPNTHLRYEIYRPLKTLSTAIDWSLHGSWPGGFHLTNIVLHYFVTLLLFTLLILCRLSRSAALGGTLLFAIHPALIENVAYISGRADILGALFLLPALIQEKRPFPGGRFIAPLCFFLACLSKETSLFFVLFLGGVYLVRKRPLFSLWPYILLAGAYLSLRHTVVGTWSQTEHYMGSFILTQATMVKIWLRYLAGFFWPTPLEILPVIPIESTWWNPRSLLAGVFFLSGLAGLYRFRHKWGMGVTGLWWFACFTLPVANWIPIKAWMAWRFMYLPWLGLCLAIAWGWHQFPWKSKLGIGCLIWLFALGALSWHTIPKYSNTRSLWNSSRLRFPKQEKPYLVLGHHLMRIHQNKEAAAILDEGLKHQSSSTYIKILRIQAHLLLSEEDRALSLLTNLAKEDVSQLDEGGLKRYFEVSLYLKQFTRILDQLPELRHRKFDKSLFLYQARAAFLSGEDNLAKPLIELLQTQAKLTSMETQELQTYMASLQEVRATAPETP